MPVLRLSMHPTVNAGASDGLQAATDNPDPAYNGSQAITVYVVEARNENA